MRWLLYPFRKIRFHFIKKSFLKCFQDEMAEEFLELLLMLMRLSFHIDSQLRKNIKGFRGLIQFRSKDNNIRVLAEFKNNRLMPKELKKKDKLKTTPNATVIFKNSEALMNFLLPKGGKRDILRSMLNNEVILEGNFNYIYRFGFLANHLQLKVTKIFK